MTRDEYIKSHWPTEIPEDCTKLSEKSHDCLERGLKRPCLSCRTYDRLYIEAEIAVRGDRLKPLT